jgi:hypothetical protein
VFFFYFFSNLTAIILLDISFYSFYTMAQVLTKKLFKLVEILLGRYSTLVVNVSSLSNTLCCDSFKRESIANSRMDFKQIIATCASKISAFILASRPKFHLNLKKWIYFSILRSLEQYSSHVHMDSCQRGPAS